MKTRISGFATIVVLLGTLGFGTATQAQYGGGGGSNQNGGQSGEQNSRSSHIVALTSTNMLVKGDSFGEFSSVEITGTNENILGIDYRPADGMLYGISSTKIYRINADTGAATEISTLSLNSQPFVLDLGQESGIDFNPVVDRLRAVGSNDQNFRINVDTGAVLMDSNINFASDDRDAGRNPSLTAAAYTNSFAGAADSNRTTVLYDIDYERDVLTIQSPPNDGTLKTVGSLNVNFDRAAGFNISGEDDALAVSNSTLYEIDLKGGSAKEVGNLPEAEYIGLAVPIDSGRSR